MPVKQKKPTKPVKPKTKPASKDVRFSVYIGPNIDGEITRGHIIPLPQEEAIASLGSAITRYPEIARFIVPGEELSGARVKIKTPGTLLHIKFKKLATGQK